VAGEYREGRRICDADGEVTGRGDYKAAGRSAGVKKPALGGPYRVGIGLKYPFIQRSSITAI
jgi:hypothetical protein